jgi:hypothetical protein
LINCEAPITETEARTILNGYLESPEVIKGLRFWITNLERTSALARLNQVAAERLAARVAKEVR